MGKPVSRCSFIIVLGIGLGALESATVARGADLFVGSFFGDRVLRYDGTTGALIGVAAQGGGLDGPQGMRLTLCEVQHLPGGQVQRPAHRRELYPPLQTLQRHRAGSGVILDLASGRQDEPDHFQFVRLYKRRRLRSGERTPQRPHVDQCTRLCMWDRHYSVLRNE